MLFRSITFVGCASISVKKMKPFNFYSDEDSEDIVFLQLKLQIWVRVVIDMYEVETDDDINPLQWDNLL